MRISLRLILTLAVLAVVVSAPRQATGDKPSHALVVVVARDSKVRSLSRAELRRCFTGSTVVVANVRVIPFNFPAGTPERVAFDHAVLGMSPEQVGRYWVDRKIRGESGAPRSLPSPLHVTKVVAKFAGAISYLPADQLTDDVVAVAIDGLAPYPIRMP
jgi:hypothetical protein